MLKNLWPAVLVLLLASCSAGVPQPTSQPAITLPANTTPLVTQIGVVLPANHLDAIKMARVIRVGTSTDYPPFEYLDSNGSRAGFDIDLMEEMAGRLGVRVEWVDMTFKDLISAVQEGKIDAAISTLAKTAEREQVVDFTEPYYTEEDAFLAAENFGGQIAKPEDAASFIVGVQGGTVQETWLKDTLVKSGAMPESKVLTYSQVDEAMADLKSGKIQLLMADYVPGAGSDPAGDRLKDCLSRNRNRRPTPYRDPKGRHRAGPGAKQIIEQLQTEGFVQKLAFQYISTTHVMNFAKINVRTIDNYDKICAKKHKIIVRQSKTVFFEGVSKCQKPIRLRAWSPVIWRGALKLSMPAPNRSLVIRLTR